MMTPKFNNIYVVCPIGTKTGGTELLHQLVYELNMIAGKTMSHIVYTGDTQHVLPASAFNSYINGKWLTLDQVEDNQENLIIFPETGFADLTKFHQINKYVWWLSVDNFYNTNYLSRILKQFGFKKTLAGILTGTFRNRSKYINSVSFNLYQSYYAKSFLQSKNVPDSKMRYLSDYINDIYTDNVQVALGHSKSNVVLYNPKKGLEYTKRLIFAAPDIKWVPLINLTNEEVKEYLISSKVYIDFGTHPGKDRFPREAAISGCCILTDKKGAAAFYNDVPIPNAYKFDDDTQDIDKIIKKIRFCLAYYEIAKSDFDSYRKFIISEKDKFKRNCKEIFFENKKV